MMTGKHPAVACMVDHHPLPAVLATSSLVDRCQAAGSTGHRVIVRVLLRLIRMEKTVMKKMGQAVPATLSWRRRRRRR